MKKRIYKEDNGFCYDILSDGDDLLIRQDTKPAVGGLNGFASKEEAGTIADLVIALMDADLSPSVTVAQITNAKTLDIKDEIEAIKDEIEKAKDTQKPKNLQ